jgi:AraC family transcriptional regulator
VHASKAASGVVLSSQGLGWNGILVERYRVGPGELVSAPVDEHRVSVHLGRSHPLLQERDGRSRRYMHRAGDVLVVAAGESTHLSWDTTTEFLRMTLPAARIIEIAEGLGRVRELCRIRGDFSHRDPRVEHLALALLRELEDGAPNGALYADSITTALTVHLVGPREVASVSALGAPGLDSLGVDSTPLRSPELARVVEHIHERLAAPLTLAELAAIAKQSPYHFARRFRQSMGIAPHQYVIRARVEEARRLLDTAGMSAAEVALQVGFASQSHLTRHMRRHLGVTPGECVKARRRH